MALLEVGRTSGTFCNRIYYTDEEGRLVERIMQKGSDEDVQAVIAENQQKAADFRPHQKGGVRQVAAVPPELMLKWLHEENVPTWGGSHVMDVVFNKKIRDPQYKYVLTVPDNYRMKRYEPA